MKACVATSARRTAVLRYEPMFFSVRLGRGGPWDWSCDPREPEGREQHARFMDRLVDDGFIVLGSRSLKVGAASAPYWLLSALGSSLDPSAFSFVDRLGWTRASGDLRARVLPDERREGGKDARVSTADQFPRPGDPDDQRYNQEVAD
jgi:hypothetical protein